ncbi:unnamed protein product [Musa textilis]
MDFGISCGGVGMGEAARSMRVQFTTKLGPPLRVPSASLAVPSNLTRMGLSEIVNILLKNCKSPTFLSKLDWSIDPLTRACFRACRRADHEAQLFDFLVDGELIRLPLEEFLLAKGISAVGLFCLIFWRCVSTSTNAGRFLALHVL